MCHTYYIKTAHGKLPKQEQNNVPDKRLLVQLRGLSGTSRGEMHARHGVGVWRTLPGLT